MAKSHFTVCASSSSLFLSLSLSLSHTHTHTHTPTHTHLSHPFLKAFSLTRPSSMRFTPSIQNCLAFPFLYAHMRRILFLSLGRYLHSIYRKLFPLRYHNFAATACSSFSLLHSFSVFQTLSLPVSQFLLRKIVYALSCVLISSLAKLFRSPIRHILLLHLMLLFVVPLHQNPFSLTAPTVGFYF